MSKIKLYFNSYKSFAYILLYYIIAMAIRYYFVVVKPDFFSTTNNYFQSLLLGVSPLVSGLILVYFFKRKNDLSLFSIGLQKTILIIILPVVLFTIVGFLNTNSFNSAITLGICTSVLYAVFEEYGWRGYLQTELKMVKPIYKYLIISVLWYFWHFDFGIDLNHLISYGYILAGSVGIGYVAEKTKSLVLPSMFHMVYNVFFSNIEDVFFYQKAIILIVCIVVIILIMRIDIIKQKKTNNLIHSKLVL